MAKIILKTPDEIMVKLKRLEGRSEEVCKRAVFAGAGVMADQVKSNLQRVTTKGYSTGDLSASLGIAPIKNEGGEINTKIGFDGYDRKGVPNVVKARVLESGSSKQAATPFMRPAINQARDRAKAEMSEAFKETLENILG